MPPSLSPAAYLPDRASAALLVIDIQERLSSAMPGDILPGVLRGARILIHAAREFDLPILVSEQYPKGLGPTRPEVLEMLPGGVSPLAKTRFSCCAEPAFGPVFEAAGPRDWILCGIEAHVCVLQTALDLLHSGQRVYVAADAVCSRAKSDWRAGLEMMRQAGAVIGSAEIFAFGLLGGAGTDSFKRISQLVK